MDEQTAHTLARAVLERRDAIERLRAENERLRIIAEAAAAACRERELTPYLVDVLDAAGYETRPRAPDPEVWFPPGAHGTERA